jgi:hypothetical protein
MLRPATNQTGSATITLTVGDGSASTQSTFLLSVVAPAQRFALKFNFQPSSSPLPSGYLLDAGFPYGDRGGGRFYGWNVDNSTSMVDRASPNSPDQRFDTFAWMQPGGGSRFWEAALSNGVYTVLVVAGDPTTFNGNYKINAEGSPMLSGTPVSSNRWVAGAKTITVSDGRLTLNNGIGSLSNKLCFAEIVGAPVAFGAAAPSWITLVGRDSNGWTSVQIDGQAGRNYVLEASSNFQLWYPLGLFQNIGGSILYIDKNSVTNVHRYYRAFLVP